MIVRELITKLGFDTNENAVKRYEARIRSIKLGAVAVAGVLTAAGAGLFAVVKSAADFGDSVFKTSQRVGVGVEALQRLQYAAGLADLESSEFSQGLVFLSRNLVEAAGGSKEASKAFKGIKLKNANGQLRSTDEVLLDLADTFSKMQDGPKKTALAVQIFGRAGSRMIPFLNAGAKGIREMGKELDDLGLVMGVDAAKAGEAFNDNLRRLHVIFSGIKNIVGAKLLPVFLRLTERFLEFIKANKDAIKTGATTFFSILSEVLARVWRIGTAVANLFSKLIDALGGFEKAMRVLIPAAGGFAIILGAISPVTAAVVALSTALGLLADDFLSFQEGQAHLLPWEKIISEVTGAVQALRDAWAGLNVVIGAFKDTLDQILAPIREIMNFFDRVGRFHLSQIGINLDEKGTQDKIGAKASSALESLPGPLDFFTGPLKMIGKGLVNIGKAAIAAQASPVLNTTPVKGGTVTGDSVQNNKFQIDQTINVNVDGGGDPAEIGKQVQKTVKEEMGRMWRGVLRNLQPGTAN